MPAQRTPIARQHHAHLATDPRPNGMRVRIVVAQYWWPWANLAATVKTGKPAFIEAMVSRLNGHSSADGANRASGVLDPVQDFEQKLLRAGLLKEAQVKKIWQQFEDEGVKAAEIARTEPVPSADSQWEHIFVNSENADWRKF